MKKVSKNAGEKKAAQKAKAMDVAEPEKAQGSESSLENADWRVKAVVTVGLDLGDRYSFYCMLNQDGEVFEEGRIATTKEAMAKHFEKETGWRIAMESGTSSPWISRMLKGYGHHVVVANAARVAAMAEKKSKTDRNDAQHLAELAYGDVRLLKPIQHRSVERQRDLNLIRVRDTLVRTRTMMINALRGLVKSDGGRLPKCDAEYFVERVEMSIPKELQEMAKPVLEQIEMCTKRIGDLDQAIEKLSEKYEEIEILKTAPGVGPIIGAAFVLTLDRVENLESSRDAGAVVGLKPGKHQSGNSDPQCGISKTGNQYLRRLLVQGGQRILGRNGPDSALRRWGLGLAASGGKRGKKRAVVAVARKLAVILHSMWKHKAKFEPFHANTKTAKAA
jgi:transposase